MDEAVPALTRCFRGHSTPAGKTFCESCGASLDLAPLRAAGEVDEVVPAGSRFRSRLRRRST